jgi:tetratricopeptide (TPR) repeat protein
MRIPSVVMSALVLVTAAPLGWANGGGAMSMPSQMSAPRSPEDQAKSKYNDGIREVKKADKYQDSAAQLTDAGKKDKALHSAQKEYAEALSLFQQALQNDPHMYEAWNYVGYTNRKLGNYDVSLAAYEHALQLHPGYPEALEYRGEAYLGLNRVSDAEQTYLDLFAANRVLADRLLAAMRGWLDTQKASSTADANTVSELDKWIQERAQIASQTASLTREGTAASWN